MLADGDQVVVDPLREVARVAGVIEDEDRGALHGVLDHRRGDAAGLVEDLHAAAVGGDQRPLGGRERNQELALGVLAVDQQRPREADRNLRHADEVLDVAARHRRVEGEAIDVLHRLAAVFRDEALPHLRHALVVVVFLVVGDLDALGGLFGDGVGDLEVELAERRGFEPHDDLVVPHGERAEVDQMDDDRLLERKVERARLRDRRGAQAFALAEIDLDPRMRRLHAVDRDARDARYGGVAQPVLQRQAHSLGGVREAAEGVELLQDERGDLQEHANSSRDSFYASLTLQRGAGAAGAAARSKTTRPPTTVRTAWTVSSSSGATASGSSDIRTKSASFPGARLPLSSSEKAA